MSRSDLLNALKSKQSLLNGNVQQKSDFAELQSSLPKKLLPDWFIDLLCRYRLCGAEFELAEEEDESGLGASLGWLELQAILSEATECQPGLAVVKMGYLPFGSDLTGSGDPYFLDLSAHSEDPMVVRVPHDYAVEAVYPIAKVERVCPLSVLIGAFSL